VALAAALQPKRSDDDGEREGMSPFFRELRISNRVMRHQKARAPVD
jgi:hypothetical protein